MADKVEKVVVVEVDPITAKDEQIAKLTEERDNYKNVALKRLGKLPGDADFVAGVDEKTGLTVEETVRKVLLDREIDQHSREKDGLIKTQAKKIDELTLALKNRPESALGGGSGENLEVKDNILSDQQLAVIRARGEKLKLSGEKLDAFVEKAKQNLLKNR